MGIMVEVASMTSHSKFRDESALGLLLVNFFFSSSTRFFHRRAWSERARRVRKNRRARLLIRIIYTGVMDKRVRYVISDGNKTYPTCRYRRSNAIHADRLTPKSRCTHRKLLHCVHRACCVLNMRRVVWRFVEVVLLSEPKLIATCYFKSIRVLVI